MIIIRLLRSILDAFSNSVVITSQRVEIPAQDAWDSYVATVSITAKAGNGYYPIGIVGVSIPSDYRSIQSFRISESGNNSGTIALRAKNFGTKMTGVVYFTIYILWTKKPLVKITGGGLSNIACFFQPLQLKEVEA